MFTHPSTKAQKCPSQLARFDLTIREVKGHKELREAILSE